MQHFSALSFYLEDLFRLYPRAVPCQSSVSQSLNCLCLNQQIELTSHHDHHSHLHLTAQLQVFVN